MARRPASARARLPRHGRARRVHDLQRLRRPVGRRPERPRRGSRPALVVVVSLGRVWSGRSSACSSGGASPMCPARSSHRSRPNERLDRARRRRRRRRRVPGSATSSMRRSCGGRHGRVSARHPDRERQRVARARSRSSDSAARSCRRRSRLVVGTGLLGGYTTFSTVSVETVLLLQRGRRRHGDRERGRHARPRARRGGARRARRAAPSRASPAADAAGAFTADPKESA